MITFTYYDIVELLFTKPLTFKFVCNNSSDEFDIRLTDLLHSFELLIIVTGMYCAKPGGIKRELYYIIK